MISDLQVQGDIDGENVSFTLTLTADVARRGTAVTLVEGDVALLASKLPDDAKLSREGNRLVATFGARGKQKLEVTFASLAGKDEPWRSTGFRIPQSSVRRLAMTCDRDDLEVQFPGALSVDRKKLATGKTQVEAFLGVGDAFSVRWKPEVKKLSAEASVECEAGTIAAAGVGALRLDTLLTYRIAQGELDRLVVEVPADVTITQVDGDDLLEWRVTGEVGQPKQLIVRLNRPREQQYALRVQGERPLPALPCRFDMPVLRPLGVVRASGFLVVGTDSAIKMVVNKATGLTQVDQDAVPQAAPAPGAPRLKPARSAYAYQYANMPYGLEVTAEDIVTTLLAESRLVLSAQDHDLVLAGELELDIREAPARDVRISFDPAWTLTLIEGDRVADYDVKDEAGARVATVYFREAAAGRQLLRVRLERTRTAGEDHFAAPFVRVAGARSERGHLVVAAEKGLRFSIAEMENLREVPLASLPNRVPDAQLAFRFKSPDWKLGLRADASTGAIHAELFHLVSLGEGALYGSCSITYHIAGAPVRSLKVSIPASYQNVEFVGRDIRAWSHDGDAWTVTFQEKVLGDYTLLVTYDQQVAAENAEVLAGGVHAIGTDSEVGYIVLAGEAEFGVEGVRTDESLIVLDDAEIPPAYALLVNDPVIKAYKYVQAPHTVAVHVRRYPTEKLIGKVADHALLETKLSREGERVTTATYFVKNSSDQFLAVTLPKGANLWTARVEGEAVQARHDESGSGKVLIPIPRNLDPNRPSRVELVYAETGRRFGFSGRASLEAPVCSAQSVFMKWCVFPPDGFHVSGAGGNMLPEREAGAGGAAGLFSAIARTWLGAPGLAMLFKACALLGALCLLAHARGGRHIVVGVVGAAASLFCLLWILPTTFQQFSYAVRCLQPGAGPLEFTKVVSFADSDLHVRVATSPAWIGATGSFWKFVVSVAAGLVLLVASRFAPARHPWRFALAMTLIVGGLSHIEVARFVVAWISVPLAGVVLAVALMRVSYRAGAQPGRAVAVERDAPPLLRPNEAGAATIQLCLAGFAVALAICTIATATVVPRPPPVLGPMPDVADVTIQVDVLPEDDTKTRIARV
ncbi:MAG TPA: hypothetical protein VIH35_03700, partial [Kiritimatiellia bacterium]